MAQQRSRLNLDIPLGDLDIPLASTEELTSECAPSPRTSPETSPLPSPSLTPRRQQEWAQTEMAVTAAATGPVLHRPAVAKGEHYYTQQQFCDFILQHFKENLRDYDADPAKALAQAEEIAIRNMCIDGRHFCRPIEALVQPITPQDQAELLKTIGVKMAVNAIEKACREAQVNVSDIDALIYTSHLPFPFPPLSTFIMNSLDFKADCVNMPCLSMGCAGGGYALRSARDWLTAHPDKVALIVNCELCSLGFRPHKNGMSWFLNTSLFGDQVTATVVHGQNCAGGTGPGLQIVHGAQRQVKHTTGVSFFTYDEWGYHFITTQALCEVAEANCPQFARDLTRTGFSKEPKDITLNIIHPGGARMIRDIGRALGLGSSSFSSKLAWTSMKKSGNVASATVTEMIHMAWDQLPMDSEVIVVGMGPGFVLDGVCLRMVPSAATSQSAEKIRAVEDEVDSISAQGIFCRIGASLDKFCRMGQKQ